MLNKIQHDVYRPLIVNGPDVTRMTSGDFGFLLCLLVFLVLLAAFEDLFQHDRLVGGDEVDVGVGGMFYEVFLVIYRPYVHFQTALLSFLQP